MWNDVNDEAGKYGLASPGGTVGVVRRVSFLQLD